MLFHTFRSQEEREAFGGSYFIEFQYCRLPSHSTIEEIISVDSIHFGGDDSLYVYGDDDNSFSSSYDAIFPTESTATEKPGLLICTESIITLSKKPTASSNHSKRSSFQSRKFWPPG